jgi:sulfhydrogenase subunit beta (sulfur reductase)
MKLVLDGVALDSIVQALRSEGYIVIGPVVANGVIAHREIRSAEELPLGVGEEQDGGRYRLVETGTDERFAFSSPSESWKQFLHPPQALVVRAKRENGRVSVSEPEYNEPPMAFFGIRSCDLAAIGILDRVFLAPDAMDASYAHRRAGLFVVAAGCANPASTCFCASMNTGPTPTAGFDISLSELHRDGRIDYLVTSGSERGEALMEMLPHRAVDDDDVLAAETVHSTAVAHMGRQLSAEAPPLAAMNLDHPRWDDVAERCLACGNCTMACPTCFCNSTHDTTNLTGTEAERWRTWESCFSLDFSALQDGPVRPAVKDRYRQWLLHKLVTWHDQFDTSGCVGCGRCITWCPVGIDITAEIAALAKEPA